VSGITTKPLSPRIGVEVKGLDPAQSIGSCEAAQLRQLLDQHGLLLFRDADVDAEAHVALLSIFGPICSEFADGRLYTQMSTVEAETDWTVYRLPFHQDGANTPHQHAVNSLFALDIDAELAVPTYFANCRAAVGDLDPNEHAQLAGLTAVHAQSLDARLREDNARVRLDLLPEMPPESTHPRTRHPVLKPHPRTGEALLFLTELQTSHIEGVGPEESERIIQNAFRLLFAPDNGYVHQWCTGDLMLWDNYMLQHARARPIPGSRRTLRRVIVNPVHGAVPSTKGQQAKAGMLAEGVA
jgi:taurine dioxygenase